MNNPKVEVVNGDKYKFKPVLNVHDRKGLLKLLTNNDAQGLGGVLVEEVEESVPHAAKALRVNMPFPVVLFTGSIHTLAGMQCVGCFFKLSPTVGRISVLYIIH